MVLITPSHTKIDKTIPITIVKKELSRLLNSNAEMPIVFVKSCGISLTQGTILVFSLEKAYFFQELMIILITYTLIKFAKIPLNNCKLLKNSDMTDPS